jgi:hypothetical protein
LEYEERCGLGEGLLFSPKLPLELLDALLVGRCSLRLSSPIEAFDCSNPPVLEV